LLATVSDGPSQSTINPVSGSSSVTALYLRRMSTVGASQFQIPQI
jgi:hypothetical protein